MPGQDLATYAGRLHPTQVAQAYRALHPKLFDGVTDSQLIDGLKAKDPDTYKLIDPRLIGAELLSAPPPPKPRVYPDTATGGLAGQPIEGLGPVPGTLPVGTSTLDSVITGGLRTGPAIVGGLAGGYFGGPYGAYAGGASGAALGETAAEYYERHYGNREAYSPGTIAFEGALGAVAPEARGATALARVGSQAAVGAGLGATGTIGRSLIEQGQLPSLPEFALNTGVGAVTGGVLHAGAEGLSAVGRNLRSAGDIATGALPVEAGAPPPSFEEIALIQSAAGAMYQQEESALAQKLRGVYGATANNNFQPLRPAGAPDYHTALQAKSYLEDLASLTDEQRQLQASLEHASTLAGTEPPVAPPYSGGPPPPLQLPETAGLGSQAPPGSFFAYPPGVNPPIEAVGTRGRADRIIGGRDVGTVPPGPPTLQEIVDRIAEGNGEPGAPELVLQPSVPRGIAEAGTSPPRQRSLPIKSRPRGQIRQSSVLGGQPPMREQPRLPHVDVPVPLSTSTESAGRAFPEGPNVNPRRANELHGVPRISKVKIKVPQKGTPYKRGKPVFYTEAWKSVESALPAEDPGMYPPEVRREMATMLAEMQEFPFVKHSYDEDGGFARSGEAGAPVFDDILASAQTRQVKEPERPDVIKALRAALLEGRGSTISDAAAEIARARLGQTTGFQISDPILPRGAGDHLIDWVDESGLSAHPAGLDEFARAAREVPDAELRGIVRARELGELDLENPYVRAATHEATRRGMIEPEQGTLTMEGPGGNKGPKLTDFEGGPPPKPTKPYTSKKDPDFSYNGIHHITLPDGRKFQVFFDRASGNWYEDLRTDNPHTSHYSDLWGWSKDELVEKLAARGQREQPTLPGAEGVRTTENPTPEVADLPFALTPPPAKPSKLSLKQALANDMGSLFSDEEGSWGSGILKPPPPHGDRKGLKAWLQQQEADHSGEPWFSRVEHFMEEGDWTRAWQAAMAASSRSRLKALSTAKTPEQEAAIARQLKGTIFQDDLNTQIVAQTRARAGVGTAPPVKEVAPSITLTQAGAKRGKASLGPAGILNPGPPSRPLSTVAPEARAGTLDNTVLKIITGAASPEGKAVIPGNRDTMIRTFRQLGEDILTDPMIDAALQEVGIDAPRELIAQHYVNTISEAGRTLNLLKQWQDQHHETLELPAERMSMGGALRGLLGRGEPPPPRVAHGGVVLSPEAQTTLTAIIDQDTSNFSRNMLANTLQRRRPTGLLREIHDATYPLMLARFATAARDFATQQARYTVDSIAHALTLPYAAILDRQTYHETLGLLKERGFTGFGRGSSITPRRAWQERLQDQYTLTTEALNGQPATDVRHYLRLLTEMPEAASHFLGMIGGEHLKTGGVDVPGLRFITKPAVTRALMSFRTASELQTRSTIGAAHFRAGLRALGHDPTDLMFRTGDALESIVGKDQLQNLFYAANSAALEGSFSGQLSRDSIPGAIVRMFNLAWPLKPILQAFPKFNFSTAPRYLHDHTLLGMLDIMRYPLDALGWTAAPGSSAGGRLFRGVRADKIERQMLPQISLEIAGAERSAAGHFADLMELQKEWAIRKRAVAHNEQIIAEFQSGKRVESSPLPENASTLQRAHDNLTAAQTALDTLGARRATAKTAFTKANTLLKGLQASKRSYLTQLMDARGINAPNLPQLLGRMTAGTVGLMGAAYMIRSQPAAEGTKFYQYPIPKALTPWKKEGEDPVMMDFRPFSPFVQYLYVMDVVQDFEKHTDWQAVHDEVGVLPKGAPGIAQQGAALAVHPRDFLNAMWNHYEGKYTADELRTQFLQAFVSISRGVSTGLTLTDLLTRETGLSPNGISDALLGTIGQLLARPTVALGQVRDVIGAFDPEEAKVRTPGASTSEHPFEPLKAPLANIPYASRLIPDSTNQLSGEAVATNYPLLRTLLGVGTSKPGFVEQERMRTGVPGSSAYIRETGDHDFDTLVAQTYSRFLKEHLPAVLKSPHYQNDLPTPARQRDYLQREIFPRFKRAALGQVRSAVGNEKYLSLTVKGEAKRYKERWLRTVQDLERETPLPESMIQAGPPDQDQGLGDPFALDQGQVGLPPPGPPGATPPGSVLGTAPPPGP